MALQGPRGIGIGLAALAFLMGGSAVAGRAIKSDLHSCRGLAGSEYTTTDSEGHPVTYHFNQLDESSCDQAAQLTMSASGDNPFEDAEGIAHTWMQTMLPLPMDGAHRILCGSGDQFTAVTVPYGSYAADNGVAVGGQENSTTDQRVTETIEKPAAFDDGWSFEPGAELNEVMNTWVNSLTCNFTLRFQYLGRDGLQMFQARGVESNCQFTPNPPNAYGCTQGPFPPSCFPGQGGPTQFWSTDGQTLLDLTNPNAPVLTRPDGTKEVMVNTGGNGGAPSGGAGADWGRYALQRSLGVAVQRTWYLQKRIDRHGNVTTFAHDAASNTTRVTDPFGRQTVYAYDESNHLAKIFAPGPGGSQQTWSLTWTPITWNPAAVFPDITCQKWQALPKSTRWTITSTPCATSNTYTTLTQLTLPDGRSYEFSYDLNASDPSNWPAGSYGWGALTQMTAPDGAVTRFTYGNQTNTLIEPTLGEGTTSWWGEPDCPAGALRLGTRQRLSTTVYPQGLSGPAVVTDVAVPPTTTSLYGSTVPPPDTCASLVWRGRAEADGTVHRTAFCVENYPLPVHPAPGWAGDNRPRALNWKAFATETLAPNGSLVEGVYFGNTGTIGDNVNRVGGLYGTWETASLYWNPLRLAWEWMAGALLDFRPTRLVHFKDGAWWTELMSYDVSNIPTDASGFPRTYGNVLRRQLVAGACFGTCTPASQTVTSFVTDAAHLARNQIRLPQSVRLEDGAGTVLVRTDTAYDQFPLAPSGQAGLDTVYTNATRGDPTSVTAYTAPAAGTGGLTRTAYFFDNGAIQKTQTPVDLGAGVFSTTVTAADFGTCYASPQPQVELVGGGGSGATGTCSVSGGSVNACSLGSGGSGYTAAPSVVLTGGSGSGAAAVATLAATSVAAVDGGVGQTDWASIPTVVFQGAATSSAVVKVQVGLANNWTVINGVPYLYIGYGYASAPGCSITGGGGSGATCACQMEAGATGVALCALENQGSGFTAPPTLTISGGGGAGESIPYPSGLTITGVTLISGGAGYASLPTANMVGTTTFGTQVAWPLGVTLVPTRVASIAVAAGGSGYGATVPSHATASTTVVNALGHTTTTVADCFTGKPLSVVDPNGNVSCNQYDGLGRLVETAGPGDVLSSQVACTGGSDPTTCFLRDAAHCTATGTAIGNGGAGATAWTEYFPFGLGGVTYGQARTVFHAKNGTSSGVTTVSFVDGLGRSAQTCQQLDPSVSGGNQAACTAVAYDNMGRVTRQYVPFGVAAMPKALAAVPAATQYTQLAYDALGRGISTQLMSGSGAGVLPATTTAYGASGNDWVTTITDANSCQSRAWTDVLGHAIQHDAQDNALVKGVCTGTPTWLSTVMQYDAAGRLLSVTDAASNVTSFGYDGLGRKISMADPDMGNWTYAYDGNGNVIQQTDARGATLHMAYDSLNRLTVKNLPYLKGGTTWVSGVPNELDEAQYYDGNLPATCHSCDDRCSTTVDTCNTATLTCSHTGTACASPDQ